MLADAVNNYRLALGCVTPGMAYAHPLPCAQTLHHLACVLAHLQRWNDAEELWHTAQRLVDAEELAYYVAWSRCHRSLLVDNISEMAEQADIALSNQATHTWHMLHAKALAYYLRGDTAHASRTWLEALGRFAVQYPLDEIAEFLDTAQPYWHCMSPGSCGAVRDTLETLLVTHPATVSNHPALTRIGCELFKLNTALGRDGWSVTQTIQSAMLFSTMRNEPAAWAPRTNAVWRIRPAVLATSAWEHRVNTALAVLHCAGRARAGVLSHARETVALSAAADVLEDCATNPAAHMAVATCIEGYYPWVYAALTRVTVEPLLPHQSAQSRRRAIALGSACAALIETNPARAGCAITVEPLFVFQRARGALCLAGGRYRAAQRVFQKALDLAPWSRSARFLRDQAGVLANMAHTHAATSVVDVARFLLENAVPEAEPCVLDERAVFRTAAWHTHPDDVDAQRRYYLDALFRRLSNSAVLLSMAPRGIQAWGPQRLSHIAAFAALQAADRSGMLQREHYHALHAWVGALLVSIPATPGHAPLIRDALQWSEYYGAVERVAPRRVVFRMNGAGWPASMKPGILWVDTHSSPIVLEEEAAEPGCAVASCVLAPRECRVRVKSYINLDEYQADTRRAHARTYFIPGTSCEDYVISLRPAHGYPVHLIVRCKAPRIVAAPGTNYVALATYAVPTRGSQVCVLSDDGSAGDDVAGDGVWTGAFELPPYCTSAVLRLINAVTGVAEPLGNRVRTFTRPDAYAPTCSVTCVFGVYSK